MEKIVQNDAIYLRKLSISDGKYFFELNNDPKVLKFTGDFPFFDLDAAKLFLSDYSNYKRDGYGRWAVCLQKNDEFIGWCGLRKSQESGLVDIGFRFYTSYWGKGYATMAARLCINYGFETLELSQIVANTYIENLASIRVLEKCGLAFNKNIMYDGREAVFYTIDKIMVKEIGAEETFPLRASILRNNIPLPISFEGDNTPTTIHLGAYSVGELVGVCSFMKSISPLVQGNQYQLRGMATSEDFQGKGIGKLMLITAIDMLKNRGVTTLWCKAREIAVAFYKKQGFKIIGNPFEIKYIGSHYIMFKKIK